MTTRGHPLRRIHVGTVVEGQKLEAEAYSNSMTAAQIERPVETLRRENVQIARGRAIRQEGSNRPFGIHTRPGAQLALLGEGREANLVHLDPLSYIAN